MSASLILFLLNMLEHLASTDQPNPLKLTRSLVNEAFILGVFCTSGRSVYCKSFGRANIGSGDSNDVGRVSPQCFLLVMVNVAHCTCFQWTLHAWPAVLVLSYIQSRDWIQIPCGNLYTIQTTILVYFRFAKKYFLFCILQYRPRSSACQTPMKH